MPKAIPYILTFDGTEGGLTDGAGLQTGFTMVDPPSARLAVDDPVFDSSVPGYEPGNLSVSGGSLIITSTKGIMFSQPSASTETNSQINALGAGFELGTNVIRIKTTISNPDFSGSNGNNSQQGGIWFGLNEDNYVKLAIAKTANTTGRVQLFVEENAVSAGDLSITGVTDINSKTFELFLDIDPVNASVIGYYSIDGGARVLVGQADLPSAFISGVDHDSNVGTANISYGGIFTTQRRAAAAQTFDLTFEDFEVRPVYKVNFQTASLTPPSGYAIDYGKGFGTSQIDGKDYGWRELGTTTNKDISAEAAGNSNGAERNRLGNYAGSTPQVQLNGTLIHFQGNHIGTWSAQPRGNAEHQWEIATGNGTYDVTVSVGDVSNSSDSKHAAVIEGISAIDLLDAAVSTGQVSAGRVIVEVTDGILTVTGLGGINSKINYIEICPTDAGAANNSLSFTPNPLAVDVGVGGINTGASTLAASTGSPSVQMIIPPNDDDGWLTLPASPVIGSNSFEVNGTGFTLVDNPTSSVVATAAGYAPAVLPVNLNITSAPVIADQSFAVDAGSPNTTVVGTIIATDDVAVVSFNITGGNDLGIFGLDNSGLLTVSDNTNLLISNSPIALTVEVEDAGGLTDDATITVSITDPVFCSPISTLACPDVIETLPFSLDFSTDAGGLGDKNDAGTGFTAVLEHSEARRAGDLPISNANINGYEPSLLTLNTGSGQLEILSQAGISFLDPPQSS
ncbi:MAG: cadherin repeat domain-containing protein, partial [Bacteroidota bacterium]